MNRRYRIATRGDCQEAPGMNSRAPRGAPPRVQDSRKRSRSPKASRSANAGTSNMVGLAQRSGAYPPAELDQLTLLILHLAFIERGVTAML